MNTIGDKIKSLRKKKGMTLEDVAEKVGVGKSTVRKWEVGIISNMRRDKISLLASALGVPAEYLLTDLTEEDSDFLSSLGNIKPKEELDIELESINNLIYEYGYQFIKVDNRVYSLDSGVLNEDEIDFIKNSVKTAAKNAYDLIKAKKEKELRSALGAKK